MATSKTTKKAGNFLKSILSAVWSPVRRGIGTGIESGLKLGGATPQQTQQARTDLPSILQLRQPERQELEQKPVLSSAKTLAGMASLAAPGAAGIGGGIKTGALAGGLGGFGASEQGQEVGGALGGAALGGLVGGAFGALGKVKNLFKSTTKAGESLRTGVRKPKVSATPFAVEEQKAISGVLDDLGAYGSAQKQAEQLPTIFRNLDDQIDEALKASTNKVSTKTVKDTVSSSIDDLVNFDPTVTAYQKAKDKFINIIEKQSGGKELTEDALVSLKRSLNKNQQMSRIFNRLDKGTVPLTAKEEVALATWQSIDDLLSGAVKDLTRKQSVLYKAAPGLLSQAGKGGLKVPVAGRVGGKLIQGGQDILGRLLQKAGGAGQAIPSVGQGVQTGARNVLLQNILQPGQGQTEPVAPEVPVQTGAVDKTKLDPERQRALDIIDQAEAQASGGGTMSGTTITPQMAAMAQILLPSSEAAKITKAYDIQQKANPAAKTKSSTALQVEGKAKTGLEAAKLIETMLTSDPTLTTKSDVPMLNLLKGQDRKLYESAVASLTDAIGGLRTGASVSKEQQEFYKNMLPSAGDSLSTIKSKLLAVKNELQGYVGTDITDEPQTSDIQSLMQMLGQ